MQVTFVLIAKTTEEDSQLTRALNEGESVVHFVIQHNLTLKFIYTTTEHVLCHLHRAH